MKDNKLHAFLARSTFCSEKCQTQHIFDQCWQLRCLKSARRCGTTTTSVFTTTTTFQLQVQLQLQLHCAASNHVSVHQWVRSAIHDSQQPTGHHSAAQKASAFQWPLCGAQQQEAEDFLNRSFLSASARKLRVRPDIGHVG